MVTYEIDLNPVGTHHLLRDRISRDKTNIHPSLVLRARTEELGRKHNARAALSEALANDIDTISGLLSSSRSAWHLAGFVLVSIDVPKDLPELQEAIGVTPANVGNRNDLPQALREFTQLQVPEWQKSKRTCPEIDELLEHGIVPVDVSDIHVRYAINKYAISLDHEDIDAKYRMGTLGREQLTQLGLDGDKHTENTAVRVTTAVENRPSNSPLPLDQQALMLNCAGTGFVLLPAQAIPAMRFENGVVGNSNQLFEFSLIQAPSLAATESGQLLLCHLAHQGAALLDARTAEAETTLRANLTAFREAQTGSEIEADD